MGCGLDDGEYLGLNGCNSLEECEDHGFDDCGALDTCQECEEDYEEDDLSDLKCCPGACDCDQAVANLEQEIPGYDALREEFARAFRTEKSAEPIDAVEAEDDDSDDDEDDGVDPMQRSDSWSDHLVRKGRTVGPRGKGNPVLTMAAKGVDSSQQAYGTPLKPKPAKELSAASDFANKYRHIGSGILDSSSASGSRGRRSESPASTEVTHSAMKALAEAEEVIEGILTGTENAEEVSSDIETEEQAEELAEHVQVHENAMCSREETSDELSDSPAAGAETLVELHSVEMCRTETSAVVASDAAETEWQHWTEVLEEIREHDEMMESRIIRCDQDIPEKCIEESINAANDVVASVDPEPQQAVRGRWRKRRPSRASVTTKVVTEEEVEQGLMSVNRSDPADEPVKVAEIENEFEAREQDPFFDWNALDKEPDCVHMRKAKVAVAKHLDGIKIVSKSYEKVRKFLEQEFAEAAEAGEDIELYVRRLQREFAGDFAVIDALDDDPKKTIGLIDEGRYYRIKNGVTMDSGCSVFVMPSGWMEMFQLEESAGSRRGQTFQAAAKNSKPIKNEGQRTIKFLTKDMEKRKMTCQVAAVNKILASVGQICDWGNEVLFRFDGGEIRHLQSGKVTPFRIIGNVYAMDAWISKAGGEDTEERQDMQVDGLKSSGFTRSGA